MTVDVHAWRADLAARLAAAGLPNVTLDPASLAGPGVLVDAIGAGTLTGGRTLTGTVQVWVTGQSPLTAAGLARLEALLPVVGEVAGATVPFELTTLDTGDLSVPAYRCELPVQLRSC